MMFRCDWLRRDSSEAMMMGQQYYPRSVEQLTMGCGKSTI
jgi:hypothetical protein